MTGKKIVVSGIRCYQRYLSPLKGVKCPYVPSCSEYAVQAVEKYGVAKGGAMAAWRILRCNPFSHGGYDPVK
ncbi:MAG: membrane protein insertion efficiency factor YidD [Lachnospiraceae bacterium]|nr:membrane protein insertion efficiency factor YidD [Lachnospiraceae bacterium]